MQLLANGINTFFHGVSADLRPLDLSLVPDACDACPDEFIVEPFQVERKLAAIDVHKSVGPDEIPNWILCTFHAG